MPPRWTLRAAACLAAIVLASCAAPTAATRTPRPNEVQVLEPAGKPESWSFAPSEVPVPKGATVTFVNRGKEFHTITADDVGRPFDLSLEAGHTGTITFANVGTFAYHCGVHPQMKGVVRVCDGACP